MWLRPWPLKRASERSDEPPVDPCAMLPAGAIWVFPILIAAGLLRILPLVWEDQPAGVDFGLYVLYAERFMASGTLPVTIPHLQLGSAEWQYLPGVPALLALLSWFASVDPLDTIPLAALVGSLEAGGVLLLAWRLFGRLEVALVSSLIAAAMPTAVEMVGWGGYPNLIGLALLPFAYANALLFWRQPGIGSGLVALLTAFAVLMVHHLSGLWLVASLGVTCLTQLLVEPRSGLPKIALLLPAGFLLGLPAMLKTATSVASMGGLSSFLTGAERFSPTERFVTNSLEHPTAAISIAVLVPGLAALTFLRRVPSEGKVLVLSHTAIAIVLAFGWLVGIHFHHWRALPFFSLPTAIAVGALLHLWPSRLTRAAVAMALVAAMTGIAIQEGQRVSKEYRVLTPALEEAAAWLKRNSGPEDVIVTSNRVGFHILRLLERPLLVAIPLRDFYSSHPQALSAARDAMAILEGDHTTLEIRRVRYIVIRAAGPDVPDPMATRTSISRDSRLALVFENPEVLVYRVGP